MTDIETVVVGAGVVGLATAAALAKAGREVIVLEREAAIGQGVSARNSEVIHAGIYYAPGSLKAQLCVKGRNMLYQYCAQRHVGHQRIGKLIVAVTDEETSTLKNLQQRAHSNGVDNLQLLDANKANTLQPGIHCVAALHSADTGIVDSHELMLSLQSDIEQYGGNVVCNSTVSAVDCHTERFQITLADGTSVSAKQLINSAGLSAIALAGKFNSFKQFYVPAPRYAMGHYFKLTGASPFTKLVYPAPVTGGLGIHLTLDLTGQARFGPDVKWLPDESTEPFDYTVDPRNAKTFYSAVRRYWPALADNTLVADYAGVRPKIRSNDNQDVDFNISTEQHHGQAGLVNLFGIESPGLTSALAIAEYVNNNI